MKSQLAPYIPTVQTHWSFSDEQAQRERAAARKQQAAVERARRQVQAILGGVIFHKLTGVKPQLTPVRPSPARKLTLADLL